MGNTDRPALTQQQELVIESAQIDVDALYWDGLWALQVLLPYAQDEHDGRRRQVTPPPPQQPARFRWIVGEYARNLFAVEARVYPDSAELPNWLENLSDRILDRVTQKLNEVESKGNSQSRSFSHHKVEPDDIVSAVRQALDKAIGLRLSRSLPTLPSPPPPPEVIEQMRNRAYAASGADIASGSPLLRMIAAAGPREHPQSPRLSSQITSASAARKVEAYMEVKGLNQTEFAIQAKTTDKTIRKFRQTGKVKRSILTGIASAMGITKEELLRP